MDRQTEGWTDRQNGRQMDELTVEWMDEQTDDQLGSRWTDKGTDIIGRAFNQWI
jgi:hypothetical protein